MINESAANRDYLRIALFAFLSLSSTLASGARASGDLRFGVGPNASAPIKSEQGAKAAPTLTSSEIVTWLHFGDLHVTTATDDGLPTFKKLIEEANAHLTKGVHFALLPGDNANEGTQEEYDLIRGAVNGLKLPLLAITGDHDLILGTELYLKNLQSTLFHSFTLGSYHFVFLDVMNGVSEDEKSWLEADLSAAKQAHLKSVLVMHAFEVAESLEEIIRKSSVIMVDAGHTHFNHVANDGHIVYSATRSTGQIEEGPAGFSLQNLDHGVVSWKFKAMGGWPFVMITSPADQRLMIDSSQVVKGTTSVHAKVWGAEKVDKMEFIVDHSAPVVMTATGDPQVWEGQLDSTKLAAGEHTLAATVISGAHTASDTIKIWVDQSGKYAAPARTFGPSNNSIGVDREKGLLGTVRKGPPWHHRLRPFALAIVILMAIRSALRRRPKNG